MEDLTRCRSIWQKQRTKPKYIPTPAGSGPCPMCGGGTRLIKGMYGKFYGCRGYPVCKGSRNYE